MYFSHHLYRVCAVLRLWVEPGTLRVVATWFSRSVVVVETAMAFVVFLPARAAAAITVVVALGMWLCIGDLFDIAWPMIGTALAGWILSAADTLPSTRRA